MHVFGLLCITCAHAKPERTPMKHAKFVGKTRVLVKIKMHQCTSCKPKCMSEVRANQRSMHAVRANYDAHSSRLMSRVYTCALNHRLYWVSVYIIYDLTCIFTSLIFCAHAGYVASIFRNALSHVVASCV